MSLLSSFDIWSDFWSDPQLKSIFAVEYGLKYSSKLMWSLMLLEHPDSKYYDLDKDSRKIRVEEDYYKDTLDLEKYEDTISKIDDFILTKTKRRLKDWETKLEERDAFIGNTPYNDESYEMLDKMMGATDKMWKQYLAILKLVEEEDSKTGGDIELSLKERGLI